MMFVAVGLSSPAFLDLQRLLCSPELATVLRFPHLAAVQWLLLPC